MIKKVFFMILCAAPLLASAQMNDVRKADILNRQSLLQLRAATSEPAGRIDSVVTKYISSGKSDEKYVYQYDDNNNIILGLYYNWDSAANAWVENEKYEAQYDSNKNLTVRISYVYSSGGEYVTKSEYQYDANNNVILALYYNWDNATNTWLYYGTNKCANQYDANNHLTGVTVSYLDNDTNTWILFGESEFQYDSNGNRTGIISFLWDSAANAWVENVKYEAQYDANNNLIESVNYDWDRYVKNTWVEKSKTVGQYDAGNHLTLKTCYDWDSNTNTWEASYKYEYQIDFNSNNNYYLEIGSYWDSNTNTWVIEQECRWYYTLFNSIVPVNGNKENIAIYPNPVASDLYIKSDLPIKRVEICSLAGTLVMQEKNVSEKISVGALPKGVYLLKVYTGKGIAVSKVVKE